MNTFPNDSDLAVNYLAAIFKDRSTSYKFLLFKSILESVKEQKQDLEFDDLALRSISYASYAINFYKLNFGHSDQISNWVNELTNGSEDKGISAEEIYKALKKSLGDPESLNFKKITKFTKDFKKLVPYRLISPWFKSNLEGKVDNEKNSIIATLSGSDSYQSLYKIIEENGKLKLVISQRWADYLYKNYAFIFGWWKSEFVLYLQKNNPTVLSLATKLEPPNERSMAEVKKLFSEFFSYQNTSPVCFYSGIEIETISHDHFLPWSFLGSDPVYNFVPTTKGINSSKSNSIPHEKYLNSLAAFQFNLFDFVRNKKTLDLFLKTM